MRAISHFSRSTQKRQASIVLMFLFACLGLMLYSSTPGLTSSRKTDVFDNKATKQRPEVAATCPTCAPPSPQVIYAPLFDVPEATSSEIVLNCRSAHELEITPTFYTLEGTPIVGEAIRLQPAEMRFVDTKSLIPARERNRHRWGGMAFSYSGNLLEAWAQLTLHGIRGGSSANVFFAVTNPGRTPSKLFGGLHATARL